MPFTQVAAKRKRDVYQNYPAGSSGFTKMVTTRPYYQWMRLSRHARNRLRWIRRAASDLDESRLLEALGKGTTIGADARGNQQIRVELGHIRLIVVLDEEAEMVVTIWREE